MVSLKDSGPLTQLIFANFVAGIVQAQLAMLLAAIFKLFSGRT